MSIEIPKSENQAETEPEFQYIKAYRVRHGRSRYREHYEGRGVIPQDEPDLTPEGVQDIERAAETIKGQIEVEKDIVVLLSSPRRRAEGAIEIIEQRLREAFPTGAIHRLDPQETKYQKRRQAIESVNLVDEEGKRIDTSDPRYPELFALEAAKLYEASGNEGMTTSGYLAANPNKQFGQFEKTEDLRDRVRQHLARLMHIARLKQPELAKQGKRLVIVQAEHNETLDELYERASGGKYTIQAKTPDKKGTGAIEGEVVELRISSNRNSNEIGVRFLGEGRDKEEKKVTFDPRKKEFLS